MAEKPIANVILDEARGAHDASRKILDLMEESGEDPIEVIMAMLQVIQTSQQTILTRLGNIEQRLASAD